MPNNWISRALHNTAQHKSAIDTYRFAEVSTAQSTGARRYINRGPAAVNDAYTIDCGAPRYLQCPGKRHRDPDGDALSITSVTAPGKGTAAVSASKIVYTPAASTCTGTTDSFSYTISDGKGGTATATVSVTVRAATTRQWHATTSSAYRAAKARRSTYSPTTVTRTATR